MIQQENKLLLNFDDLSPRAKNNLLFCAKVSSLDQITDAHLICLASDPSQIFYNKGDGKQIFNELVNFLEKHKYLKPSYKRNLSDLALNRMYVSVINKVKKVNLEERRVFLSQGLHQKRQSCKARLIRYGSQEATTRIF